MRFDRLRAGGWLSRPFAGAVPLVLLCLGVGLVSVLAWQAQSAAASHRALAERVLHDYADLAATEVARRSTSYIGNYGFGVAIRAMRRVMVPMRETGAVDQARATLPSVEAIRAAMPTQSIRAIELVGARFRFDTNGERFDVDGGDVSTDIRDTLRDRARQPRDRPAEYRVLHVEPNGRTRVFVFAEEGETFIGFEARLDAVGQWYADFVTRDPLLPTSLASREAAQASMLVLVRSPDGRVLYRSSRAAWPSSAITITRTLDDASDNSLRDFIVDVSIDPAAAHRLVIGGLPESRVGVLLALLVLTIGLAAAAIVQIAREEALSRLREEFVTRASHELRTPVARIRMFAETLRLDRVRSDEERQRALEAIERGSLRLSHLIENVMQVARQRSRAAAPAIHPEPLNTSDLAREVIDDFEAMVDRRATAHDTNGARDTHDFITLDAPPVASGLVDREAFRQILLNLLDNAAKYAGHATPIDVAIDTNDGHVRVSVSDRGPGVPARDRERVWLPYVRLDRDRRSSIAGTGIGLAVVRDLVTQHGGTCWIEESAAGGVRAVATFPATPARATREDA